MRAIVVTGGRAPARSLLEPWLEPGALVVAADSGLKSVVRYGLVPAIVAGDFDSLGDPALLDRYPSARVERFPTAKDETDTEIAIRLAREAGAREIVLVGGGGGRLDHLLGIRELFEREDHPAAWISDAGIVRAVDTDVVVRGRPGMLVSFLPVGPGPCTMRSTGLRWPLDGVRWTRGALGLSNEFMGEEMSVTMLTGRLLMMLRAEDL